jgi:hypothetical protein
MENEEIVRGKMGGYQNPESGEDQHPAISQNILDIGGTPVRYNLQIYIPLAGNSELWTLLPIKFVIHRPVYFSGLRKAEKLVRTDCIG